MKFLQTITFPFSLLIGLLFSYGALSQDSALGDWHTVDDETGKLKSLVTLSLADDGSMIGIVSKVLEENAGDGLCDKCEGDKKNKPIEGMQFIWGVERIAEGEWKNGQLLDPETGTVYNGNITITDNPNELEVRGYVGISFFGRTQTWRRVEMESAL